MKKFYRFFGAFLEEQEKFLNTKASEGYRLVRVNKIYFEFEKCSNNEYKYALDFIADKSYSESEDYRLFLEDLGYKIFYKNINLNYSIGKARFRPYAKRNGKLATNSTTLDKEIMIIEKKNDNKPFTLHTTYEDKINYYKNLRNMWSSWTMSEILLLLMCLYLTKEIFTFEVLLLGSFIVLSFFPFILYQRKVVQFKNMSKFEQ